MPEDARTAQQPFRWSNSVPPIYSEPVSFAALTYFTCWTCGALVLHRDVHDRWHDANAEQQPSTNTAQEGT